MATSTAVHSNAFNFMSFIQNQVDPRTGQYVFTVALPELQSNALAGPVIPLQISFNPMNIADGGFGLGWELKLSELRITGVDQVTGTQHGILALHTGETFAVEIPRTGDARVPEQKIKSFMLSRVGDTYRVEHKSGLAEVLTRQGGEHYMPTQILSRQGHSVNLSYQTYAGNPLLEAIHEPGNPNPLFRVVVHSGLMLDLVFHAGETHTATYTIVKNGAGQVVQFILPADTAIGEKADWRFEYAMFDGRAGQKINCLTNVATPTGGIETIEYGSKHTAPSGLQLPRVTQHISYPQFEQPPIVTLFEYDSQGYNFLGNGAHDIVWADDGLDNLYQTKGDYRYTTVEKLLSASGGTALRTTTRAFNRFHLLTKETVDRPRLDAPGLFFRHETTTEYHLTSGSFASQLPKCQLPKTVTQSWYKPDVPVEIYTEAEHTDYDAFGNLIEQIDATGVTETQSWYAAAGEDGCPADRFVRNLKSKTVTPAQSGHGTAPTLKTVYRYELFPKAAAGNLPAEAVTWVGMTEEALFDGATAVNTSHYSYYDQVDGGIAYGRKARDTFTSNGHVTTTDYAYSVSTFASRNKAAPSPHAGEAVLNTITTLTGFDKTSKVFTLQHSTVNAQPLLTHDDNYVEIEYVYDALRRVLKETVSPGNEEFEASRIYTYTLTNGKGQQATQSAQDVKGVVTRSYVDGNNRVVREERWDQDKLGGVAKFRDVYQASYDVLDQLREETLIDWEGASNVKLTSKHFYDDWQSPSSVQRPDGVTEHEVSDPIERTTTQWLESKDKQTLSAKTVTHNNVFDKPDRVERLDLQGKRYSTHSYLYDGLGRTAKETDAETNVTEYVYDVFNRMVLSTLPDGSKVMRAYAPHNGEDLPVKISVAGNFRNKAQTVVLGEQAFDGLDRMITSVTGGRRTEYSFEPGQRQPKSVKRPSGKVTEYDYQPQLGEDPKQRRADSGADGIANYVYDKHNARLTDTSELDEEGNTHTLARTYFSTGELRTERREKIKPGAQRAAQEDSFEMIYDYSRQARLISYTDVLGQVQTYQYDAAARLINTALGSTSSVFAYNALGLNYSTDTTDGGQRLQVELEYDAYNRETLRTFRISQAGAADVVQTLAQEYDRVDRLTRRTLSQGSELLRDETYQYDRRGRLEVYTCEGPQAPQDPYGHYIQEQVFAFDAIDNITFVWTTFEVNGESMANESAYAYVLDNPSKDPCQLVSVTNDYTASYPALLEFNYDADGNMLTDEAGRTLGYDSLGRLISVSGDAPQLERS